MGFFSDTIATVLAGRTVTLARLAELDFADGVFRAWEGGFGPLVTSDGKTWLGAGELGSISAIPSATGGAAPQVTLKLSGISSTLIGEIANSEANVKGRDATIYYQYFDSDWTPLDAPYSVFVGLMDVMTMKQLSSAEWNTELTLEGLFTKRGRPAWGFLSDRSQQGRYPGDLGLSQMSAMRLAQPWWPVF